MSKLLFDEHPITIDRTLAKILGLNESIVIQQLHYWVKINEAKKSNFHDGRYWTYNSLKEWHEKNFDFWSFDTVRRTFAKLEKMGLLHTGNYNQDSRDRTKWYAINYEMLESIVNDHKCKSAKCTNGDTPAIVQNANVQNEQMDECKMTRPLPEITTENNPCLIGCEDSSDQINHSSEINVEVWDELKDQSKSVMIRDTVSLYESDYLQEIQVMLEKHFPNQLDAEVIKLAAQLFSDRSYDWKEFKMKMNIENPVGFFRSCYIDAIKQWKLKRM